MDGNVTLLPIWKWIGLAIIFIGAMAAILSLLEKRDRNRVIFARNKRYLSDISKPANAQKPVLMASYTEIKSEYERRLQLWRVTGEQVHASLKMIESFDYRVMDAPELLSHAPVEEVSNLAAIVGVAADSEPMAIVLALRRAGSYGAASFFRGGDVKYEEVVRDVAHKLGANNLPKSCATSELERLAVGAAMEQMLAKASPEQRRNILTELAKNQINSPNALMTATGGLVLANLSGFGLYVAASSSLAAMTSAVGLTLPFAVYSGISSALAAVTGPAGWAALALIAIVKFGGAEYKKTVPGVIAIASTRARLIANREDEMFKLNKQRSLNDERGRHLTVLAKFVSDMEHAGTSHNVPRASVPW